MVLLFRVFEGLGFRVMRVLAISALLTRTSPQNVVVVSHEGLPK